MFVLLTGLMRRAADYFAHRARDDIDRAGAGLAALARRRPASRPRVELLVTLDRVSLAGARTRPRSPRREGSGGFAVPMVLTRPRSVFAAMRDDSAGGGGRPPGAGPSVVFLAGIAAVLSFSARPDELLDDPAVDGHLVAVIAFLGGGIYGFAGYWLGGGALYWGERGADRARRSYRQARHLLGLRDDAAGAVARRRLADPAGDLRRGQLPYAAAPTTGGRDVSSADRRRFLLWSLVARPGRRPRAERLDDDPSRSGRSS